MKRSDKEPFMGRSRTSSMDPPEILHLSRHHANNVTTMGVNGMRITFHCPPRSLFRCLRADAQDV